MSGAGDAAQQSWDDEDGRRWAADADRRDRVLAPVAEALLSAAQLGPGEQVLDIGCGCGATTLQAAGQVAPDGTVAGIDVSAPMLEVARARLAASGLGNVRFVHADAQSHAFPGLFDVVISRFGTMFFTDPAAAFTTLASGMRSGARLVLATWQPLAANDWLIIPGAELLRYGTMPALGEGPGMFAQSDPAVVERVLTGAGFVHARLSDVRLPLTLGADLDEAVDYLAHSGPGRTVLATVPAHERDAALSDVRAALTDHADQAGVHMNAAIWLITATRP
ncbi:class I SAM-dependent methyltransferase [Nonomuraea sp. NPDC049480]|uniref:class I SAM-dependent methyltransferase n=1 Tax=Nonomuraea sp. NPDC049480 TaxID=3364353 RepID=UPI0037A71443